MRREAVVGIPPVGQRDRRGGVVGVHLLSACNIFPKPIRRHIENCRRFDAKLHVCDEVRDIPAGTPVGSFRGECDRDEDRGDGNELHHEKKKSMLLDTTAN